MIKYQCLVKESTIKEITVSGHALYDKSGKDIVCAAVSTAIYVTANAIESLKEDHNIDLKIDDGYFNLKVKNSTTIVEGLLRNLEYTLDELEKQYSKYIKNQKER